MSNLNLARKLRPKTFDEIIGQDLSVSMLKNSIYLKKLFPVYLFSGQRGCGKTSTARVFGSAVNCKKLDYFQRDAKNNSVPCLSCDSCQSMLKSNHPDFIEMDAASNTGVDSVRQIIESCTYMPLAGSKKIYLIDEAHMLSKAAFNAFLKILEEPPSSTIFILATTEMHKIPETVRSRCFQVIFNPVQDASLFAHIQKICSSEHIDADKEALRLLVEENDGSVRDAINSLEQVRFSGKKITKDLVLKSMGKIGEGQLFSLAKNILSQEPKALLENLKAIKFEELSAQNLWNMLLQYFKKMLYTKYGVQTGQVLPEKVKTTIDSCTVNKIHALMQMMWAQESIFLQTPQKHLFLESLLLQMCHQTNIEDIKTLLRNQKQSSSPSPVSPPKAQNHKPPSPVQAKTPPSTPAVQPPQDASPWNAFLSEIEKVSQDPLLISIFRQSKFLGLKTNDGTKPQVRLQISNNIFFKEKIKDTENVWKPVLQKIFKSVDSFALEASLLVQKRPASGVSNPPKAPSSASDQSAEKKTALPHDSGQSRQARPYNPQKAGPASWKKSSAGPAAGKFEISDPDKWPRASLLIKNFSGKLEKDKESPSMAD